MRIRIRLFASFAEAAGWREKDVELPEGATAGDALAELRRGALMRLPDGARPLLAVNRSQVPPARVLEEGDELAVFPPVSGGSGRVEVTAAPLDPRRLADAVRHDGAGAVVIFEGTVRDHADGIDVSAVSYEAHEEMALEVLESIRREVESRHPGVRLAAAHRTGLLPVGQTSVVVAASAPHRREAFAACRLAMDRIKESLPVWKREEERSGRRRWR